MPFSPGLNGSSGSLTADDPPKSLHSAMDSCDDFYLPMDPLTNTTLFPSEEITVYTEGLPGGPADEDGIPMPTSETRTVALRRILFTEEPEGVTYPTPDSDGTRRKTSARVLRFGDPGFQIDKRVHD